MDHDLNNPAPTARPGRAGLSAMLIVGLLIGVTINAVRPGVLSHGRDRSAERLATRQIAQSLARAVRELARVDVHKPAISWSRESRLLCLAPGRPAAVPPSLAASPTMLREALLALPPPVA